MADGRFDWYERVRVVTADPAKAAIAGLLGAVLGKAQGDDGRWSYGVFVYDEQRVWSCWENELAPTGEFDRRESFYSGESIRVSQRGEVLGYQRHAEPGATGQPETRCCDECGSDYFAASSQMASLCPECSHRLHGYPACVHEFAGGRCSRCGWDGSVSAYLRKLHSQREE